MGHRLNVSTNARNGFVVTVFEDQNPLSQTGADIDLFRDGNATSSPSAWVSPANTLNQEQTYGHIGITSDDDLNSDEFGSALFVGNFQSTTTRQIFTATGTADGTTASIGSTTVALQCNSDVLGDQPVSGSPMIHSKPPHDAGAFVPDITHGMMEPLMRTFSRYGALLVAIGMGVSMLLAPSAARADGVTMQPAIIEDRIEPRAREIRSFCLDDAFSADRDDRSRGNR
jgi:hypothetical protein